MESKKYRLLCDLPDGSIAGDEYQFGGNFYWNTRIHNEAKAVDEGHRWDSWQVENNPKFFEEIKEQPKEVFTWNDGLVGDYLAQHFTETFKSLEAIEKGEEPTPITSMRDFKQSKQSFERKSKPMSESDVICPPQSLKPDSKEIESSEWCIKQVEKLQEKVLWWTEQYKILHQDQRDKIVNAFNAARDIKDEYKKEFSLNLQNFKYNLAANYLTSISNNK